MTERTLVSVYEVGEDGGTGALLGGGSLVDPRLVLVHPVLSHALAAARDRRLRVGIASPAPGSALVEVIDVRAIQVAENTEPEPLVALDLSRSAGAPVEPIRPASAAAMAAAVRQHLARLPTGDLHPVLDHTDGNPFCELFPSSWACK